MFRFRMMPYSLTLLCRFLKCMYLKAVALANLRSSKRPYFLFSYSLLCLILKKMGYFSNTACVTIVEALKHWLFCRTLELLHKQGAGSVATKGVQLDQWGPCPADYSNMSMAEILWSPKSGRILMKCVVAKHKFTFLQLQTKGLLKLFREFALYISIMFQRNRLSDIVIAPSCKIPVVYIYLASLANSWKILVMFDGKCT